MANTASPINLFKIPLFSSIIGTSALKYSFKIIVTSLALIDSEIDVKFRISANNTLTSAFLPPREILSMFSTTFFITSTDKYLPIAF